MVPNKLHGDAKKAMGLLKQMNSYQSSLTFLFFEVPLRYLRPTVIYFVPCDRILQRAYTTTHVLPRFPAPMCVRKGDECSGPICLHLFTRLINLKSLY